jgi:hypothetical protein
MLARQADSTRLDSADRADFISSAQKVGGAAMLRFRFMIKADDQRFQNAHAHFT